MGARRLRSRRLVYTSGQHGQWGGDVRGPSRRTAVTVALACGLALGPAMGGCAFGPRALERSYGPYYESVRHAEEEELLRNLVHIRYNETPSALGVSSIA